MNHHPQHLVAASLLAIFLAVMSFRAAAAQTPLPPLPISDCILCHADQTLRWQKGSHGQSCTAFLEEWQKQGNPAACTVCHLPDGPTVQAISCTQCHAPVPANHPTENMPVTQSAALCGNCHTNPAFSQTDWQQSGHAQSGIACASCHDPHTTGPRLEQAQNGDLSALCLNCHQPMQESFPDSAHAQAGVSCVDCHLAQDTSADGFLTAHRAPDHRFQPSIQTCSKCHAAQMHAPGDAAGGAPLDVNAALIHSSAEPLQDKPEPVSPLGFAAVAALIGLAAGMALAPWLERMYQRLMRGGRS